MGAPRMKKSTMFLANLSVVDHAVLIPEGLIRGNSHNPSFEVSGVVDEVENVVCDFSTIKKRMKQLIDDHDMGFDHKCWILKDFSQYFKFDSAGKEVTFEEALAMPPQQLLTVTSKAVKITGPRNSFKFIDMHGTNPDVFYQQYLKEHLPEFDFVCRTTHDVHTMPVEDPEHPTCIHKNYEYWFFSYVHGLKDSTSYGCQNIAHGHLSYLHTNVPTTSVEINSALRSIITEINDTIFIRKDNVVKDTPDQLVFEYNCKRGFYRMEIDKNKEFVKYAILDTETTIEHLVEYIATKYHDILVNDIGATKLYVSEGLSKGAVVDL
jgi:6-pyruvoyl-tetrahydropterin synthase